MQLCDFKMTSRIRTFSRISHGAEWAMTGTPWSYAAFRRAGCARSNLMPGHNEQTNPRLISTVQIIEPISPSAISRGMSAKPGPPGRCIFNGSPPSPRVRRGFPTTRQQSAKQTHLWSTRVYVSRWTRERLADNLYAEYSWEPSSRTCHFAVKEMKETLARKGRKLIVIALICLTHIHAIDR